MQIRTYKNIPIRIKRKTPKNFKMAYTAEIQNEFHLSCKLDDCRHCFKTFKLEEIKKTIQISSDICCQSVGEAIQYASLVKGLSIASELFKWYFVSKIVLTYCEKKLFL